MEENNLNNHQKSNSNKAIIIVLVLIILGLLGFIVYDKFLQKDTKPETNTQEKECNCPKCEENGNNSFDLGEKISSFNKIEISKTNQTYRIGNKEVLLRKDDSDHLVVNDQIAKTLVDGENIEVIFIYAYLTDKYVFFTDVGNADESIVYAINENGEAIVINNNKYQQGDYKLIDGYLHATGYIFCGLDCPAESNDLIIKYDSNTLTVVPSK